MGIPHLITHLRPYATVVCCDGSGQQPPSSRLIVDGPALAYHVYYQHLVQISRGQDALALALSHQFLGLAAIAWLDHLKKCGLTISKIYFDGALPLEKQDVRISRLQASVSQLTNYYLSHLTLNCKLGASRDTESSAYPSAGLTRANRSRSTGLPAPAFLVPAVLEALRDSPEYARVIHIVPGEADAYCAGYAEEHGGIILTGDSDLLAYNIGEEGSVVFLSDMEFLEIDDAGTTVDHPLVRNVIFPCYQSAAIQRRLNLPKPFGMAAVAFEIDKDPSCGFVGVLQRARSRLSSDYRSSGFRGFLSRYSGALLESPGTRRETASLQELLQVLDPRTSELVCQYFQTRSVVDSTSREQDSLKMYLPFILDEPTRSSAWEIGVVYRTLGYSLLNLSIQSSLPRVAMLEMRRRGQRIVGTEITLLGSDEVRGSIVSILNLVHSLADMLAGDSDTIVQETWRCLVIHDIIQYHRQRDKSPPTRSQFKAILPIAQSEEVQIQTWASVHLLAQQQAGLYSLRILKQFADTALAVTQLTGESTLARTEPGLLVTELSALIAKLEWLPPVSAFPPTITAVVGTATTSLDAWVDDAYQVAYSLVADDENSLEEGQEALDEQAQTRNLSAKPRRKRKKRKTAAKGVRTATASTGVGGRGLQNMFTVLQVD